MMDQYFGVKELYEVVLKAKTPMQFGARKLEQGEPVLYFENISMSVLSEDSRPIMARGGWQNMPRVIWEDRSEVVFTLTEGVMSSISMGVLLSANVSEPVSNEPIKVPKREGPMNLQPVKDHGNNLMPIEHWPIEYPDKKMFIYEYERDVAQRKMYGKIIHGIPDPWDSTRDRPYVAVFEDKVCETSADTNKQYIIDYYYKYNNDALIYTINKERFNGLFTLEGKFYSKDETEGLNYTNLIYMPKVRVVSDINLRLGEKADPSTSVFNIIGIPETTTSNRKGLILEITRLSEDIDDK